MNNLTSRDLTLDAVKGFLILCVVLEHNSLLTASHSWIRPFSDGFAVGCFFIITFIWPVNSSSIKNFVDRYCAYLIPFLWLTLVTATLNSLLFLKAPLDETIVGWLNMLLISSPYEIKNTTGFMYLWFIPSLVALYFFRFIFDRLHYSFNIIPFILFLIIGQFPPESLVKLPFSLHVIAFIYVLGVIYSKLHPWLLSLGKVSSAFLILCFIVICLISEWVGWELFLAAGVIPSWEQPLLLAYYSCFILIAIPATYKALYFLPKKISTFFAIFGVNSLKIYLFHPLIYFLITQILPIVTDPIISFILTLAFSLLLTLAINKMKTIHLIIFPSNISSLNIFRR